MALPKFWAMLEPNQSIMSAQWEGGGAELAMQRVPEQLLQQQ